jgi:hypothetical protein
MMPVFYETKNFKVKAADEALIDRKDGGHVLIIPKSYDASKEHRWQLKTKVAENLMTLSMIVGEAMFKAMIKRGIPLERINFQDNGNWSIGTKRKNKVHLHLFGRAKNSKHQKRGESIVFPKKKTKFWKKLNPLNEGDIKEILRQMKIISKKKKYKNTRWKSL